MGQFMRSIFCTLLALAKGYQNNRQNACNCSRFVPDVAVHEILLTVQFIL